MSIDQLTASALALEPSERLKLADLLYESLDRDGEDSVLAVDEELAAELERRAEAFETGEDEVMDASTFLERLWAAVQPEVAEK